MNYISSSDGKYIAVGSHDNYIYLYTVSEDGRVYKKTGKLSASVHNLQTKFN